MEYKIGDDYELKAIHITKELIDKFAELSGDNNYLHTEEAIFKSPFKKPIAHGILVASYISTVLGMYFPGPGTIYRYQSMEFKYPVYLDDTIRIKITVSGLYKHNLTLKTEVFNQDDKLVLVGCAQVALPKKKEKITIH